MGIENTEQVEHAGGGKEARAVIACRPGNIRPTMFNELGNKVEDSRAEVGEEPEHVKGIAARGRKDVSTQGQPDDGKCAYAHKKHERPAPPAQEEVAKSRHQPSGRYDRQRKESTITDRFPLFGLFFLRHSVSSQQGKDFGLHRSGYARLLLLDVYIHFAAHPKLRQIYSRLHREAGARNDAADILSF